VEGLTNWWSDTELLARQLVPSESYQPGCEQLVNWRVVIWAACEWNFDMQSQHRPIDRVHTRAITREIAERLRTQLAQDQPAHPGKSLQSLIDRLPELDGPSPPIAPEQHLSG
jgi:hypothetical protein